MTPSNGNMDKLETLIERTLRAQPARRAPQDLQARVFAEIGRRAALPWWRNNFARWPLAARAGFLIASIGFVRLALAAVMWASEALHSPQVAGALNPARDWLHGPASIRHRRRRDIRAAGGAVVLALCRSCRGARFVRRTFRARCRRLPHTLRKSMNTSLLKLLACSLLACCTLAMRAVPARDFVSSQSETTPAAAAAEASEHDDDADADDSDDAKAAVGRGRRSHHRSNGDSVVAVGHNATLAEDARAEEVVSVFGSSTSAGRVDDAVVSVFGNTHVTTSTSTARWAATWSP